MTPALLTRMCSGPVQPSVKARTVSRSSRSSRAAVTCSLPVVVTMSAAVRSAAARSRAATRDGRAGRREGAGGLHADSRRRPGDDGGPPGQVDALDHLERRAPRVERRGDAHVVLSSIVTIRLVSYRSRGNRPVGHHDGGRLGRMPPTVVVTGATDGLGRALALRLAERRAPARPARAPRAPGRVRRGRHRPHHRRRAAPHGRRRPGRAGPGRAAGRRSCARCRVDVLVNNAGIGSGVPDGRERRTSVDGHELRFAVNYLSGFLLTELLADHSPRLRGRACRLARRPRRLARPAAPRLRRPHARARLLRRPRLRPEQARPDHGRRSSWRAVSRPRS